MLVRRRDNLIWKRGFIGELDYIGWSLCILRFWVVLLAILGRNKIKKSRFLQFFFIFLNRTIILLFLIRFYVSSFIFFYLRFETCLIPIFFLILGWGYQPERAQAGIYILFYTLFGSLPLFFLIIEIENGGCGYIHSIGLVSRRGLFFYLFLVGAFLVKFPIYSVHLWLLKAHVEAPVAGSMILAGVILKLGGYGLVRFLPFWVSSPGVIREIILCLSLWGGIMIRLSCLRQIDIKLLIASSSVVHMSMCIGGLFVLREWGLKGRVAVMVGHGLCSSGLFYLANVVYERTRRRSMSISKGLLRLIPRICFWWFVLLAANMAAPPSLNLLGEILLIRVLVSWRKVSMVIIGFLSFFRAAYRLYLFSLSQHGVYLYRNRGFHSGCILEYTVSSAHWIPLNLIIMCLLWVIC